MNGLNPFDDASRKAPSISAYEFGAFRIDLDLCQLKRGGDVVPLSPKAFDTLLMLVRCCDRVVSKDELLKAVWPDSFVSDDSLTQNISVLRRALGDESSHPERIVTIPRRGYRFVGPVVTLPRTIASPADAEHLDGFLARNVQPPSHSLSAWRSIALMAAVVAASILISNWGRVFPGSIPAGHGLIRFTLDPPPGVEIVSGGVLSPDGAVVAFVGQRDSDPARLWINELRKNEPHVLPGTEQAFRPFWAPDGRSLAFFAEGKLKTVDLIGTPPQTIATVAPTPAGGTWSRDGTILFADRLSALYSVSSKGGTVHPATRLNREHQERRHRWPQFLPDGRHFLYFVVSENADREGTYLGDLDSEASVRILNGPSPAVFGLPGNIFYVRDGALVSQPFDPQHLRLAGAASIMASGVSAPEMSNGDTISIASDVLTFGGSAREERLTWFDRAGHRLRSIDANRRLSNPMFSPDHRRLLVQTPESTRSAIWLLDEAASTPMTLVPDGSVPVWSPDGLRVAYTSGKTAGVDDIFVRSAQTEAADELVLQTPATKHVNDWSPDGRYIVYVETNPRTQLDLWLLPMFGAHTPIPFLRTSANELQAQVSPDGHWVAYASDESGQMEIYAQPFPNSGGARHKVSIGGGVEPQWRRDGQELFYLDLRHTLMAVPVLSGNLWQTRTPSALFDTNIAAGSSPRNHYAVGENGQRFLISAVDGEHARRSPMTFLVNWTALTR